jgi:hypothetical protein
MSFGNISTMEKQCHMKMTKTMYKDANFFVSLTSKQALVDFATLVID